MRMVDPDCRNDGPIRSQYAIISYLSLIMLVLCRATRTTKDNVLPMVFCNFFEIIVSRNDCYKGYVKSGVPFPAVLLVVDGI